MHYHSEDEIRSMQSTYEQHPLVENIQHTSITIAKMIEMILYSSAAILSEQQYLKLSLSELCQIIHSATEPAAIYENKIQILKNNPNIIKFQHWTTLQHFFYQLEVLQTLCNAPWKNIAPLLSTKMEYILSAIKEETPYPELEENDQALLTNVTHSLATEHVRSIINDITKYNCFRQFAQYCAPLSLAIDPHARTKYASSNENCDRQTLSTIVLNATSIIESAKATFHHQQSPEFYTFCIRVLDSILTISASRLNQALFQHYQHYNIPNDAQLRSLHQCILNLTTNLTAHEQPTVHVTHALIELLTLDRKNFIYDRHYNYATMHHYQLGTNELNKHVDKDLQARCFAQKADYLTSAPVKIAHEIGSRTEENLSIRCNICDESHPTKCQ